MRKGKVLVIDDERLIRWSLEEHLSQEGFEVFTAEDGEKGLKIVEEEHPEAVFLDIRLPGMNGMEVLEKIKEIDKGTVVIMITAYGDVDTAVKAMKLGAFDYISKPFNLDEMVIILNKALENQELKQEVHRFRHKMKGEYTIDRMVGRSEKMLMVFDLVKKIAQSETTTILIQGESGTGKDLVAKAIHYQSSRADKPFMEINCTSLPDTLVESELFGHEKGAFTDAKSLKRGLFELADGGTVLLDEIGDLQPAAQAKLLRAIEDKTFKRVGGVRDIRVDVRVIGTTNKDLERAVLEGRFREDLYYRLKIIPLYLPPLRERMEDLPLLVEHFINKFNQEFRKKVKGISKEALDALMKYHWPGNVRELKNVIERAMILMTGDVIQPEDIPLEVGGEKRLQPCIPIEQEAPFFIPPGGIDLKGLEQELIKKALEVCQGNRSRAARLLGVSRDTLKYRMKKFGLG